MNAAGSKFTSPEQKDLLNGCLEERRQVKTPVFREATEHTHKPNGQASNETNSSPTSTMQVTPNLRISTQAGKLEKHFNIGEKRYLDGLGACM